MVIFLFGAGNIGKKALQKIGEENVAAFVDNKNDEETLLYNKRIIPFSVARKYANEETIFIISTGLEYASEIAKQLRCEKLLNYLFWWEINEFRKRDIIGKCENFIRNGETESDRLNAEIMVYRRELNRATFQRDYLLLHSEPSTMRPAMGKLRKRQLDLVAFAEDIFKIIGEEIHPILAAGNLLGLVRHGGFIPWDDDMDFKLIREDYSKLVDFCRKSFFNLTYFGKSVYAGGEKDIEKWTDEVLRAHPNEVIFIEMPYHVQIWKGTSYQDNVYLDFFVIDAYRDDYSFFDHKKTLSKLRKEMMEAETCKDAYSIIEKYQIDDMEYWAQNDGNNFFYGFDNVESYDYYRLNDNWITRDMILPLKKVNFEGGNFYIPNNPEECLKYVFGDHYMNLPTDIALHTHIEERGDR